MSLRVAVRPLTDADAIGVHDAAQDVHLILIAQLLNPGEQLVAAAHLAERLRGEPRDAAIQFRVGAFIAGGPSLACPELVDLMDQRELSLDDYAAVLHYLFPPDAAERAEITENARRAEITERPPSWPTYGPRS